MKVFRIVFYLSLAPQRARYEEGAAAEVGRPPVAPCEGRERREHRDDLVPVPVAYRVHHTFSRKRLAPGSVFMYLAAVSGFSASNLLASNLRVSFAAFHVQSVRPLCVRVSASPI